MTITPDLDILEQLTGGPKPVAVVRRIFDSKTQFCCTLLAMLYAGDIRLVRDERTEVRSWEWQTVLSDPSEWPYHRLCLTEQGSRRV